PLRPLLHLLMHTPAPTLFPYTTLFRSIEEDRQRDHQGGAINLHFQDAQARDDDEPDHGGHRDDFGETDVEDIAPQEEPFFVFEQDRKSTRLNSSHVKISYAVFCLKKKN